MTRTADGWRRRLGWRLAVADAVVIAFSSWAAYQIRVGLAATGTLQPFDNVLPAVIGVLPLWLAIFYWLGAYRPEYLNAGADAFRRFTAGVVGGLLALGFLSFFFRLLVPRVYVGLLTVFVFVLGGLVRAALQAWLTSRRARGRFVQGVLVVGIDPDAVGVARSLARDPLAGYEPRGYLAEDVPVGIHVDADLEVLGRPCEVLEIARRVGAGLVLVAPAGLAPGTLRDVTVALEGSEIDLAVAPSFFEVVSRRVLVETVGNVPIMHVQQVRLSRGKAAAKRLLDLVVAGVLGLLSLPVALACAVAVRSDSPGPVLFRQQRVGRDGTTITVLKFRTMREDAAAQQEELRRSTGLDGVNDPFFKVDDDPRVTRVGRVLRTWSLDEIPQFWNVLRGDMTMVGPRPLPGSVEDLEPWQRRRLRVRPGITGLWQVSGRSYLDADEAVRADIFYIENWSLGWDLLILSQTVAAVLGRRGAQ